MIINITKYRIVWSDGNSPYGAIDVADNGGNRSRLRTSDPSLLSFWAETLRNERPMFYNTISKVLYSGTEPIGEEET